MDTIEKTLEYHPLIMTLDSFDGVPKYALPAGYKFVFWSGDCDIENWINIHLRTGEFASWEEGKSIFHSFYDKFYQELFKRCFFIENEKGEKIATATVSPSKEFGYNCVIDWLGISRQFQGKNLARPLISQTLTLAQNLGYDKIALHTQTHTWLAAKLYLDFGFAPYNIQDRRGWQILKTLTNHSSLKDFETLKEEIFDPLIVNIKNQLDKMHREYFYSVWYIDGRNDVLVNDQGKFFHYKFFNEGKLLKKV
ncbi:MAG: GNAT family N-acetyltransferase [Clostridia bacterium]|nr:GNAT family N-acetyltransferase [Clostridia bacterium]